jgi:2'-hydroxyisoflavone reductase
MELLILGGGVFLGRALVEAAVQAGHSVTVFNRGRSRERWPIEVEPLVGDRRSSLAPLAGRRFDAVIDTCGYRPQDLELSCGLLADACERYLFVSSISAYASLATPPILESDATAALAGHDTQEVSGENYGPLKAECERVVTNHFGARGLLVRPGLIVGRDDPTGRFSYWVWRAARGGRLLAPAPAERAIQFIDARDLAAFMLRLVDGGTGGAYNASGPIEGATLGELVEAAAHLAGVEYEPAWVADDFLVEQGVTPWSELPLWVPESDESTRALYAVSLARARSAGLRTRPLAQSVHDILAAGLPAPEDTRLAGKLAPARERELLAAWDALSPSTASR